MTLPFRLQDFSRVIWHNAKAREVWGERVSRVNTAWAQIERLAVVQGARDACLTFFDPQLLPVAAQQAIREGVLIIPLTANGMTAQYSSTPTQVVAGQPWQYRVVIIRPEAAQDWVRAWNNGQVDDMAVGKLLGYPECCRAFFQRVWVDNKGVDTSWDMGLNTPHLQQRRSWAGGEEVRLGSGLPPEANILLRWLGVRLVPHLPCSLNCELTVKNARMYLDVGRKAGFDQEMDWALEMLDWPVEWSALHGIAEVKTPVCTVSTRTDATAGNRVVQRLSHAYPEEGAQGLRFPFKTGPARVTSKPAFARGFEVPDPQLPLMTEWGKNGFSTEAGMQAAHKTVLAVLPFKGGTFLDLGCGSGRLLEMAAEQGWSRVQGVELEADRAAGAKVPVVVANLLDTKSWAGKWDVIAFMPGRLLEGASAEQAQAVRQALMSRAGAVLMYAYGDWLDKYGGLDGLITAAGFGHSEVWKTSKGAGVEAALVMLSHLSGGADESVEEQRVESQR